MKQLQAIVFCVAKIFLKLFYPKAELFGLEHLPNEPCIIVGNHSQMHGPILGELHFPGKRFIWCASEMMKLKEVPAYAFRDFWSKKPRWQRPFYRLLSFVIAPLSVCVFNQAHTIAVYHDRRVISTFKETMKRLSEGANIIIFPEQETPHNHILWDFQEGFVDVATLYLKRTGKALQFVPLYIAPNLHQMHLGQPICFDPENPMKEERKRICAGLMDSITEMAESLPRHKVVPYPNLPRKAYGFNKEERT